LPEIALGILKEMGEIDSAFMEIDFVSSPHPLDRSSQDQEKKCEYDGENYIFRTYNSEE
jgi:hypothetical protein